MVVSVALLSLSTCSKEKALPPLPPFECDTTTISFQNDIAPIFQTRCYVGGAQIACHSEWVYSWDGIDGVDYFDKIEKSVLQNRDMPPPQNEWDIEILTYEELNMIYCWYEQGAPDN